MAKESLRSYNAVIKHTLLKAIELGEQSPKSQKLGRRGIAGFCQLQGSTGSGKSSSLYRQSSADAIAPALELIKDANRQAILVTHRWNILHDIFHSAISHTDSKGKPFSVSVLYAQDENVVSAVTQTPLPHEKDLQSSDMPDPFDAIKRLATRHLLVHDDINKKLSQTCSRIKSVSDSLKSKNSRFSPRYVALEEEDLRRYCASLERILLKNMAALEKEVKKATKQYGKNSDQTKATAKRLAAFRADNWVRRVFPAICWHDDRQHLLIMTTQKLFSSFYDGQDKVRISHHNLSGHVIFIDEFDYQADVLQRLLSQAQPIQEPPECLGQLLEGGKRLLQRMRYVMTEPVPEINKQLQEFIDALEDDLKAKNIDLGHSRALVVPLKHYQEGKAFKEQFLFRSDHLVTSQPLTMRRASHGYEIEERKTQEEEITNSVDVSDFLRVMEKFIRQFSLMLSDFASAEDEAREYVLKLSKLLFDPANDYRPSYYSSTLPNLSLFSLPRANLVEIKSLTDSNILPNTHANVFGLTNWLLKQNTSEEDLDPLRIQIKRAFLPTTPEGLLLSLASRNLVFALSATSYIERSIGHFDIRWLASALRYIAEARNPSVTTSFLGSEFCERPKAWFKQPIPYVQYDSDLQLQHSMIEQVSKEKASIRKTKLQLQVHEFGQIQQSYEGQEILESLSPEFFQSGVESITDDVREYRQKVLCMLLDTISLAGKNHKHKGKLAFVNSTRYLRKWLLDSDAQQSREKVSWLERDGSFSSILNNDAALKTCDADRRFDDVFIPVRIHDSSAIICLLTAECQRRVGFSEAYQTAFNTGRVVLVLTQTASATNGINLDFSLPDTGERMDLTCLYLLEAQHFYFSNFEESNDTRDEMAHAGYQLRNLDKLCRAGELSRSEHRRNILPLMTNSKHEIAALNKLYKRSDDYVKNTAANVQQQVGRVERAWQYVPQVEIHLTSTLAGTLTRFASMPTFSNNRSLISNLNIQLLEALLERRDATRCDFITQIMTPSQPGEQAVEIIDNKLIPAIRESRNSLKDTHELARLWDQLGRAILQHDYKWKPTHKVYGIETTLRDWACFERPIDSKPNGSIWYNPDTWQFFHSPDEGRIRYNPERLYEHIQRHKPVVDWFNRKGYRTSITPFANDVEERYALHPLVVQRLLQGRLGEEAIRALLHDRGVETHTVLNDLRVLELYDFSISNSDFRVDAKFWGQSSQNQADLDYQKWLSEGAKPDKAPLGLIKKLAQIREVEGPNTKLAILNFVALREDTPLLGFDSALKPTLVNQADILILGGCVTDNTVTNYTPGFEKFVKLVSRRSNIKEACDALD